MNLPTPWTRVLLEKLTGSAASQEIPRIFGTRRFLPYSQVPTTCPYPEPTPSSPHNPLPLPEDPSKLNYMMYNDSVRTSQRTQRASVKNKPFCEYCIAKPSLYESYGIQNYPALCGQNTYSWMLNLVAHFLSIRYKGLTLYSHPCFCRAGALQMYSLPKFSMRFLFLCPVYITHNLLQLSTSVLACRPMPGIFPKVCGRFILCCPHDSFILPFQTVCGL